MADAHLVHPVHNPRRAARLNCSGLGERVVAVRIAYAHGQAIGAEHVSLHVTDIMMHSEDKWTKRSREQSWLEIVDLFPPDTLTVVAHDYRGSDTREFVGLVRRCGHGEADTWHFGDTMGMFERDYPIGIDASPYIRGSQLLKPNFDVGSLPDRLAVIQPCGGRPENSCDAREEENLIQTYKRSGYAVIVVGHRSKNPVYAKSIKHVAGALAACDVYVGCDSGITHLASLYVPYDRMRLLPGRRGRYRSHWLANGVSEETCQK